VHATVGPSDRRDGGRKLGADDFAPAADGLGAPVFRAGAFFGGAFFGAAALRAGGLDFGF
jgi:hypothetical protein